MLNIRYATANDIELYYKWVTDYKVRQNSLNTEKIEFNDHQKWFTKKLTNENVFMYIFLTPENIPVGQVIIEIRGFWSSIGQSVAKEHRGKKYSPEMLTRATNDFLDRFPKQTIVSVVKSANIASLKMSKKSGFTILEAEGKSESRLVLKGNQQNNKAFIQKSKRLFDF